MIPDGSISGTWKGENKAIKFNLPLIIFEEDGSQIVYCPSLDISGYGNNETEAIESFQVCLGEFLMYTIHKKTFHSELERLGWKFKKNSPKPMTPPDMIRLLEKNENFSRIFNNFPFRKIDSPIELPV
jgi:hypothetical protein